MRPAQNSAIHTPRSLSASSEDANGSARHLLQRAAKRSVEGSNGFSGDTFLTINQDQMNFSLKPDAENEWIVLAIGNASASHPRDVESGVDVTTLLSKRDNLVALRTRRNERNNHA
jgi:hypothetical protein